VGYSLEYMTEQIGYAVGQYTGEELFKSGRLEPIAAMVTSADAFFVFASIFALYIFSARRYVVDPKTSESTTTGTHEPQVIEE
jgi:hypothetical protein